MGKTNSELDQRTKILEQKAKPLEENVIKTASAPSLRRLPLSFLVSSGQLVSLSAPPATAFQALFETQLQRHHPAPQLWTLEAARPHCYSSPDVVWLAHIGPSWSILSIGSHEWTVCPKTCCGIELCQFEQVHGNKVPRNMIIPQSHHPQYQVIWHYLWSCSLIFEDVWAVYDS